MIKFEEVILSYSPSWVVVVGDVNATIACSISAKKMNASYRDIPSYERKRIGGNKKVNEFRDGFKILIYMIKRFLNF